MALLAILQSAIISYIPLLEGTPNLVLLAIVAWSLTGRAREAMILGLLGGIFLDMLSGFPLASTSISLILIAHLVSLLEGGFWETNFFTPLVATLMASLVYFALTILFLLLSGRSFDLTASLSRVVLPSLFLNLILALPVYHMAEWVSKVLNPSRVST